MLLLLRRARAFSHLLLLCDWFVLCAMSWKWQVLYEIKGTPYWWDYPAHISAELERCQSAGGIVHFTHEYESRYYQPSGSIAVGHAADVANDADDGDGEPAAKRPQIQPQMFISMYHLFAGRKLQRNVNSPFRERQMRRIWVDEG